MNLPYRFGRYVLIKKIAQGGMAEIFKAKYLGESGFSKDVCIKRLLPVWSDNPDFTKMLIDEAKALVHLAHPNIVQVYELGRDGKTFYISMELVEGVDLRKLFSRVTGEGHPLPLKFVLYIVGEILKALKFAHQRKNEGGEALKIVHRDISPQNILIAFDGQVKVTDFGIAKGMHRSLETTQHQVKGKYAYMSPEQAKGETVDERTDLYAAGILLFELLERRRLFDCINDLATLEKVREARLPEEALRDYPAPLRAVVLKSLQREKIYRYPDAAAFLKDLQPIVAQENLETNAEEFSDYLKDIFPPAVLQETLAGKIFPTATGKFYQNFPKTAWLAGLALVILGLGLWAGRGFWQIGKQVVDSPPVALASPPPEEKKGQGSIAIEAKPGLLKISARPWGEVTIPGILHRQETPVAGMRLKAGEYRIQVFYPPQNQQVEQVIRLASGAQLFCQAEFGPSPQLVCR